MGAPIKLSERLTAIAQMVSPGKRACDVGCDHGFVSIYLVQQGICPFILAMDVRKGPLEQARMHIAEAGLETKIETRLSDGVRNYHKGEAQSLILAGMGGRLMMRILSNPNAEDFEELVLSPQSEIGLFRHFLQEQGWYTVAENMIYEEGKYYPVIKAVRPKKGECVAMEEGFQPERIPEELAFRFGRLLLLQKNPVLYRFLQQEKEKLETLLAKLEETESLRGQERKTVLEEDLDYISKAISLF